jgi:hypothetical protein
MPLPYQIDGHGYTKQQVWAWLKAENHYHPPKEELRPVANRAARRRNR